MNSVPVTGPTPAEREESARLLPAPAVGAFPSDRHFVLKDNLVNEFARTTGLTQQVRRRLPIVGVSLAAAAAAVAAFLVVTKPAPAEFAPVIAVEQGDASGAAPMLERVAHTVEQRASVALGKDEYLYVKSMISYSKPAEERADGGRMVMDPLHAREIWLPADKGKQRLVKENGNEFEVENLERHGKGVLGLPTDPDALLTALYEETKGQMESHGADAAVFDAIGSKLQESLASNELSAALYRAAAKVPGVVLVPDAVDANGRHGVAVALTDKSGERTEWIFDRDKFDFLGERAYLVRDTDRGAAGTVTAQTALLARTKVAQAGDTP
ncbi:CU044_5270 family protein [Lentzea sp. NPDC034063]|uniref:CU044_5270 family protein n=1 Tax=unclassified Lentzea TaxID=2643253 RepID=UPI0033E8F298